MTQPLKGKKYRTTFILTSEERFETDEMAIYESESTLSSLTGGLIAGTEKKAFILRIDRYNGNKPSTRIFPEPKYDSLLALNEVIAYILDTEDTKDAEEAQSVVDNARKVHIQFLKKI